MLAEERRNRLLELIQTQGFASLEELRQNLRVSESTIRRDLDHLETVGVAKRTHGGVFFTGSSAAGLPNFIEGPTAQWDKKRLIAARAAELIEDHDAVLIDGGSTAYEVARVLVNRPLQVVTNSLPVANLFASRPNIDLTFIGGFVYPRTGVALGPFANEMLEKINVRRTVMSVGGATDRGFFNSNVLLVETERAMMRAADEVIVVADSTKFGHQSLAHLCELSAVQQLVVDDELSPEWQEKIASAGVRLILAARTEGDANASPAGETSETTENGARSSRGKRAARR